MTSHTRLVSVLAVTAALAGSACTFDEPPPLPGQRADVAAVSACRERADEVFQRQNRDQVYRVDTYRTDTLDAPFGTTGMKGVTSAGLSQQYNRDNLVQDCLRGTSAGAQPPMSRDLHSNNPSTP